MTNRLEALSWRFCFLIIAVMCALVGPAESDSWAPPAFATPTDVHVLIFPPAPVDFLSWIANDTTAPEALRSTAATAREHPSRSSLDQNVTNDFAVAFAAANALRNGSTARLEAHVVGVLDHSNSSASLRFWRDRLPEALSVQVSSLQGLLGALVEVTAACFHEEEVHSMRPEGLVAVLVLCVRGAFVKVLLQSVVGHSSVRLDGCVFNSTEAVPLSCSAALPAITFVDYFAMQSKGRNLSTVNAAIQSLFPSLSPPLSLIRGTSANIAAVDAASKLLVAPSAAHRFFLNTTSATELVLPDFVVCDGFGSAIATDVALDAMRELASAIENKTMTRDAARQMLVDFVADLCGPTTRLYILPISAGNATTHTTLAFVGRFVVFVGPASAIVSGPSQAATLALVQAMNGASVNHGAIFSAAALPASPNGMNIMIRAAVMTADAFVVNVVHGFGADGGVLRNESTRRVVSDAIVASTSARVRKRVVVRFIEIAGDSSALLVDPRNFALHRVNREFTAHPLAALKSIFGADGDVDNATTAAPATPNSTAAPSPPDTVVPASPTTAPNTSSQPTSSAPPPPLPTGPNATSHSASMRTASVKSNPDAGVSNRSISLSYSFSNSSSYDNSTAPATQAPDDGLSGKIRLLRLAVLDTVAIISMSSVSAVMTLVSAVVNPALTAQTARIYLIIQLSTCNFADLSNIEVIFYPLQFGIGDDPTAKYFASVVFTWPFAMVLFALHAAFTFFMGRGGPIRLAIAKRRYHFPSLSMTALLLFFWQPLIMASVTVLSRGVAQYARAMSLCLLIAALAITSFLVRWYYQRFVRVEFIDAAEYAIRIEEDFKEVEAMIEQEKAERGEASSDSNDRGKNTNSKKKSGGAENKRKNRSRRGRGGRGSDEDDDDDDDGNDAEEERHQRRQQHVVVQVPMSASAATEQRTFIERFCTAPGTWYDKVIDEKLAAHYPFVKRGFTDRFGYMFLKYRAGRHWFFLVEIVVSTLLGIAEGVKPLSIVRCWALSVFHFVVLAVYFLLMAALRPYLTLFDNLSFAVLALAQALSVLFLVIDARRDRSMEELLDELSGGAPTFAPGAGNSTATVVPTPIPSEDIELAERTAAGIRAGAEFLAFSCFSLCVLKGLLDVALMVYFWRKRQKQFEPVSESSDSDDDDSKRTKKKEKAARDDNSDTDDHDDRDGRSSKKSRRNNGDSDDEFFEDETPREASPRGKATPAFSIGSPRTPGSAMKRKGSGKKGNAGDTDLDDDVLLLPPALTSKNRSFRRSTRSDDDRSDADVRERDSKAQPLLSLPQRDSPRGSRSSNNLSMSKRPTSGSFASELFSDGGEEMLSRKGSDAKNKKKGRTSRGSDEDASDDNTKKGKREKESKEKKKNRR